MSTAAEIERIVRGLPKVSLHCHLIGSVQAKTLVELAAKHGVTLDGGRTAENLFDHASYEDLDEFLRVLDVAGSVIRDVDDFHRVTYESLTAGGAAYNVLYREIFLSPPGHPGVAYRTIIDGVRAGMRDAETDTGICSNLIVGLNRNDTPGAAIELVETMIANPYDEVIGTLKEIAGFFKSPAGSRYVAAQPKVLDGLFIEMQAWSRKLSEYMLTRVRAELKKKNIDL